MMLSNVIVDITISRRSFVFSQSCLEVPANLSDVGGLARLLRNKDKKRRTEPDVNWVRNISSRLLDKTETRILSYGMKHSVTPKRIPTKAIVSSVEAVLSRQRDLSEPIKDNIRSRIASTRQSASLHDSNLTKDEQQALKRLKNDKTLLYYTCTS